MAATSDRRAEQESDQDERRVAAGDGKIESGRRVVRGANRGEEGRSGPSPARSEVRQDHRPPDRQGRQGESHRRRPGQCRRDRSGADDDRGHRLRSTSTSMSTSGRSSATSRRRSHGRPDNQKSLREQKSPSPSAWTPTRGFRTGHARVSPTSSTPRAPARSSSAASRRIRTGCSSPAPASACGCR